MYFTLTYSIDRKKVGTIPQSNRITGKLTGGLSVALKEDLSKIINSPNFPENIKILQEILLDEEAKVTDWIRTTYLSEMIGIIISDRFHQKIKDIKIFNCKIYNSIITHKKREYPYWFYFQKDLRDYIVYPKSEFMVKKIFESEILEIKKLGSFEEHNTLGINESMKLNEIVPKTIYLNKNHDLIKLPHDPMLYISDKVKNIIEENKFSGMDIRPSNVDFIFES